MSIERPRMRRHLRFTRYLPVECTVLSPKQPQPQPLDGMTRNVNAGGLEVLLLEPVPVKTLVSVRVAGGDPVPGHIVSVGEGIPTLRGKRFPHGVAFEGPVEPSLVRQWVSQPDKRSHPRLQVQFDVAYAQEGTRAHGTCRNLCQGGMFITCERSAEPETEIMLHFKLPSSSRAFSVRARVAWISGPEENPAAITGMGVQFLDLDPSEASAIGAFVDHLCAEASAPDPSPFIPSSW